MKSPNVRKRQSGALLIEAMVGILVFTIAVLGMVGLQASLMKETQQSRYRVEASFLANSLVATMWGDTVGAHGGYQWADAPDATPRDCPAGVPADPPVTPSDRVATWCAAVTNLLPGAQVAIDVSPGVPTPPSGSPPGTPVGSPSRVAITITWNIAGDPDPNYQHRYRTVAFIGP